MPPWAAGGHSRLIAERLWPTGRLIGLDQDAAMIELARPRLAGLPITLVQASFSELPRVLRDLGLGMVDGVLADLGICSDQLDDPARGFSFSASGPLDMRMNLDEGETARDLLLRLNERDLADLIFQYGEERFSRRIARRIVDMSPPAAVGHHRSARGSGPPVCAAAEAQAWPARRPSTRPRASSRQCASPSTTS